MIVKVVNFPVDPPSMLVVLLCDTKFKTLDPMIYKRISITCTIMSPFGGGNGGPRACPNLQVEAPQSDNKPANNSMCNASQHTYLHIWYST
jgi:hypothetical protein